uniref:Uncharacterized protein n=1 Tax=Clytia hemisphaerica TaxID=252671 RepID=A0A7M5UVA4_9CNID
SAKYYYVNLNIVNQLQSPVQLSWRYALVMDSYKLFTNEKPVQIGADSNKKISLRFGAPSVDQSLPNRNLIVFYATSQNDQNSGSGALLINGLPTLSASFSELQGVNRMIVNISKPEENLYAVKLNIRNPMKTTAYIKWELNTDRYPDLKLAQTISKQDMSIQPGDNFNQIISLNITAPITALSVLRNAIIFRASHGPWKNPAFLNVKKQLPTDLHLTTNPKDLSDFPINISDSGFVYGVRLTFENTFKKPIQTTWILKKYTKNYFTDNLKSYIIGPGTRKDILLQFRFQNPISIDDLKSLVVLTATYTDNQNVVLLNGEQYLTVEAYPIRRGMKPVSSLVVQSSIPTSK